MRARKPLKILTFWFFKSPFDSRLIALVKSRFIEFEKKKLCNVGLGKLAKQIEHTSQEVGDNEGYDIKSFTEQGELLYIEVKSTEQDHDGGFYISQNEITVANKMQQQKKQKKSKVLKLD